ncbi:MAG: uracil-DNA glycosylase [Chitinivibrionales bacterium]|nr:uracil-DNA glycosylase [Chitinivibrionales bacterium]MBD3357425.1 uracil-DNA glycosylase [Chitinivibrionales bacterium]
MALPVKKKKMSTDTKTDDKREALKKLYYSVRNCRSCGLASTRKKLVFGAGAASASVLIIGEAPGAQEDVQGLPFVGAAGTLLTKMLAAIKLDRKKDVFITNVVKCRPPENRDPESSEIAACEHILSGQIEVIQPKVILVLGRIAAQSLLGVAKPVGALRGDGHEYKGIPVVVTYHPAALLRNARYKRPAWEDLQKLERLLGQQDTNGG